MEKEKTTSVKNANQPTWLTFIRVLLGLILLWKGYNFIRDIAELKSLISQTGVGVFTQNMNILAILISILTLLCGVFITVGFFTRLSCLIQLPIVVMAIIFVNIKNIDRNAFELVLTIIVFILLILFALKGSGKLSADEYFRRGAEVDKSSDKLFR